MSSWILNGSPDKLQKDQSMTQLNLCTSVVCRVPVNFYLASMLAFSLIGGFNVFAASSSQENRAVEMSVSLEF